MLVPENYLVEQAEDGRMSLYIPTYFIDVNTNKETLTYHQDGFVDLPDEWFIKLQSKGSRLYTNPGPRVRDITLYPSEIGWNHMKKDILDAYANRKVFRDNGVTGHIKGFDRHLEAEDFEKIVEEFYANIKQDGNSKDIDILIYWYAKNEVKKMKMKEKLR